MRICIAQTRPVKGDIRSNIKTHRELAALAASHGAALIIFPELSLTGYEPALAKELAMDPFDSRLDDFQQLSEAGKISIGIGLPTKNDRGICISMLLFQPGQARKTYSKKYLHVDEVEFFVCGEAFNTFQVNSATIALAICYELSIAEHSKAAFESGAEIYIASVAKSAAGVSAAAKSLSEIAQKYSMTVLMSNSIGPCDNFISAGKTAIWNPDGLLAAQLDDAHEGILLVDTATRKVIRKVL